MDQLAVTYAKTQTYDAFEKYPGLIWLVVALIALIFLSAIIEAAARKPAAASYVPPPSQPTKDQPAVSYDAAKWEVLQEVDPDIAAAVNKAAFYGKKYVDTLARKYLAVNDKQYLPAILEKVIAEAEAKETDRLNADEKRQTALLELQKTNRAEAEIAKQEIEANGMIDPMTEKQVLSFSFYDGQRADDIGALQIQFSDRSIEIRRKGSRSFIYNDSDTRLA